MNEIEEEVNTHRMYFPYGTNAGDVYAKPVLKMITTYVDRKLQSVDSKPAVIEYQKNGKIINEKWFHAGNLHREDGPASILYATDGRVKHYAYYKHGKVHRSELDGPAIIKPQEGLEHYYKNGVLHRERGPAILKRGVGDLYYLEGRLLNFWETYEMVGEEAKKILLRDGFHKEGSGRE